MPDTAAKPPSSTRDPRYDILFEPVQIGPVTAKNRFYQVPHCTGSGWEKPRTLAALRGMKAEGGWAVVNTEYCSVHPAFDDTPHPLASLWDDGDIQAHALMTEQVHAHGALAGVELILGGSRMANYTTREIPVSLGNQPVSWHTPFQTRAMDKDDIREMRRWHLNAVLRAKKAGFDIVYVYATHGYLLSQLLSTTYNTRTDEYGGSLENRVRLLREIIEETKEAVGDTMGVAVRLSAEVNAGELGGQGETPEILSMIGELPDLWDININDYLIEMGLSRFVPQGALESRVEGLKALTSKPLVTVGRMTSPDAMASLIRRGVVDFIGAARPSIADPFLPKKIEEGRLEDIRECIGCNICYTGDGIGAPIRCTQNPTMSEEWRRGWHPERIQPKRSNARVLVVGAGPAGLEAAHQLGKRGYEVMLAEATRELGGRVSREARLPGLSEWIRVRDYRLQQLDKLTNVEIFRESAMGVDDILAVGADHVAIATGATWRRDGYGGANARGIADLGPADRVFTPDDILAGRLPDGPAVVFDDDHYYLGTVLAEAVHAAGVPVTLVTPADTVAEWGAYTHDHWQARGRLMELGVEMVTAHNIARFDGQEVVITCNYSDRVRAIPAEALVLITARIPNDTLYGEVAARIAAGADGAPRSVTRIGDCDAPGIIATAVYAGHRYARELEETIDRDNPLKHDRVFFVDPDAA